MYDFSATTTTRTIYNNIFQNMWLLIFCA
jgi:hypothetical protein